MIILRRDWSPWVICYLNGDQAGSYGFYEEYLTLFLRNLSMSDCKRSRLGVLIYRGDWTKKVEEDGADAWLANGQNRFIWEVFKRSDMVWGAYSLHVRSMQNAFKTRLLAFWPFERRAAFFISAAD